MDIKNIRKNNFACSQSSNCSVFIAKKMPSFPVHVFLIKHPSESINAIIILIDMTDYKDGQSTTNLFLLYDQCDRLHFLQLSQFPR